MVNKNSILKELIDASNEALKKKDYLKAKNILKNIILIKDNIFEIHNNLGIVFLNINELENSINHFEKAIKLNPEFSVSYFNLGVVYEKLNDSKNATKNYLKVIELDKKNFIACFNIGNLFKLENKIDKAEKYLLEAIKLNPNFIRAYNNLFEIFDRSNQVDKFEKLLNLSKVNLKNKTFINFFSGILEYKKRNYENVIRIYEKINLDPNDTGHQIVINELLAKSYDNVRNYEKAFETFQNSNNQIYKIYKNKYNKINYINLINKRSDYFNKKNISKWNALKVDSENEPIFLFGFPRSGTTLVDTILSSHPLVNVLEENGIIDQFINLLSMRIKNNFNNLKKVDLKLLKDMRQNYFQTRNKFSIFNSKKIYIDKMPLNLVYTGEIVRFFPNAKFIFVIRNPYDAVLSSFMQQFLPNDAMLNLTNIKDATQLYDVVMNLWFKYNDIFNLNVHSIKYEDVVQNFDETIKNLLNFLNLSWNDKLSEFYKISAKRGIINTPSYDQVNKPLYNKSINRWLNYETKFSDSKKILNKWVKKFNY